MARATFTFPAGFLWGSATASHQVEGNNTNNDWYAWEQIPGKIINGDKSGKACDWWNGRRWRDDFDRAHEAYQNAHRFSIEWSRVQPEADRWDESAIDRYREMLLGLKERDMVSMVTLFHFSSPLWFVEMGGWENEAAVGLFEAYVRRTVSALKAHCNLWVTINEPNVYAVGGWMAGGFPPGKNDVKLGMRVLANLAKGHAAAYRAIHELQPDAKVGVAHNHRGFVAADYNPLTRLVVNKLDQGYNLVFAETLRSGKFDGIYLKEDIPQAKDTQDFVGLNYYTRDLVKFDLMKANDQFSRRFFAKDAEVSHTGFIANDPEGFKQSIKWAAEYGLPVYITENGVEDPDDGFRRLYLLEHLLAMWHMINHNKQVKGYFHWSQVDNFEWERGWTQRFGLWGLDPATQQRIRRPSVDLYSDICRTNSITSEAVEKWAPEVYSRIYPGRSSG